MTREDLTMDDDFDPQLADRFRVLDRVSVPTTWSPADATVVVHSARRGRGMVFAAAASVVAIALVAVAVFTRDRGASVVGPSSQASTTAAFMTSVPTNSSSPATTEATSVPMTGLLAIGESVMIGAIAELEAAGFVLDAKEGRGPEGARLAIQRHLDDGTLPDTVVIQVGTNAPLRQEELDAILDLLAGRTVVMMTVHAPDIAYIDANNELIRSLPERYPNVKIADWDVLVDGGSVTLTPDGIHLGEYGPAPYVQLILDTLAAD